MARQVLKAARGLVGVVGLAAAALVVAPTPAQAEIQAVYAAPDGHGQACTSRQPCSIVQAKNAAARRTAYGRDVTVLLAGGTYQLTAPLTFGPGDSGVDGKRVTWTAAPGAHPVLSGGTTITGWRQDTGDLWSAPVPADLNTRQLYADGTRIPRSSGSSPVALTQTAGGFTAADGTLATWRNPSDIEFVFDGGHGAWTQPLCDVATISGTAITMKQPCWSNMDLPSTPTAPDGDNPSGGFPALDKSATPTRIENAYELLSPGTWYLDRTHHTVYYDPRPGENPATMHFVAPVLEQLITTSSTADNPLHDITFSGITFAYTTWLTPSGDNGFPEMQANMYVEGVNGANSQGLCQYVSPAGSCPFAAWSRPPAAVDLVGTRNVRITGDTFTHLGAAGLGTYHGARSDVLSGNEIDDVSGNGIEFGTTDDPQPTAFATDLAAGRRAIHHGSWWQVDLGSVQPLWQTRITATDLGDFWVFVSTTPIDGSQPPQRIAARPGVWSSHQNGAAVVPTDTQGRYVTIVGAGTPAKVAVTSGAEISVDNTISDNYIHDTGVEYTGAAGIWGGYARRTTVSHNEIGNLPYSGISYGWAGWHTNATTPDTNPNIQADNVIADNVIYDVMGVRHDGAPIYTNGPQGQSLAHGLTVRGNVTFANKQSSFAVYNDEGGAYITIDGNAQYVDGGSFNGGCSTIGHIVVKNSYRVGALNNYFCDNVGTDFVDGGGNTLIPYNPGPGVIPNTALATAGLEPPFRHLSTAPAVLAVSPITDHQVLVSGRGFAPNAAVTINGVKATSTVHIGPNHLTAVLPDSVYDGYVQVGASPIGDAAYTYDPSRNIAQGKAATQSSTAFGAPPANAVDGNTNGSYFAGSLSHTDYDQYAWWQVDLGASQSIAGINLWNRTDCCADRATDYWVFVSDTPFDHSLPPAQQAARPGVWSSHQPGAMGRPTRLPVGASGRYVMVQLAGTNYLALAEVQVFRTP
ncbi:discoidin domain-containing protein [Kutzneria buriramensis]|uniref:Parallel beta helix pectate lyase-like protein n=1 Tax=Kutzneria buriramensis TaxID=1045776 RepID=A0A3E0GVS6_9PSEU|nr:discoidin domain-containing protein [Kutzneria buriramensis]REH29613.1 parallel beta helix pectate lyase-like protein [Kutzneria buriramensis]